MVAVKVSMRYYFGMKFVICRADHSAPSPPLPLTYIAGMDALLNDYRATEPDYTPGIWRALGWHWLFEQFHDESWRRQRG